MVLAEYLTRCAGLEVARICYFAASRKTFDHRLRACDADELFRHAILQHPCGVARTDGLHIWSGPMRGVSRRLHLRPANCAGKRQTADNESNHVPYPSADAATA